MTIGQICYQHEYCTHCPVRQQCTVRSSFYDEVEYNAWRQKTIAMTTVLAKSFGIPQMYIPSGVMDGIKMMDKRREMELKIHPTYSPK